MSTLLHKPSRLMIYAYSNREMTHPAGSLSVMYNPDSISLSYQTEYVPDLFINTTRQSNRYVQTRPGGLSLELLLDSRMPGNRKSIDRQLTDLKILCYNVNPAQSEPRYLKVKWGKMRWNSRGYFSGRISGMSIRYTLFARDATPLRATVTLELTTDGSLELQGAEEQLLSPGAVVVKVPDVTSLTSIADNAGHSLAGNTDYLTVASENNLDALDAIEPGQVLRLSAEQGVNS